MGIVSKKDDFDFESITLQDMVLNEDMIDEMMIPPLELCYIKLHAENNEINEEEPGLGPFWTKHLARFSEFHKVFTNLMTYKIAGSSSWEYLNEIEGLKYKAIREESSENPTVNLTEDGQEKTSVQEKRIEQIDIKVEGNELDEYFLIQNGQKYGPVNSGYLKKQLENGSLIYSDIVSIDKGETWYKFFQVTAFDRRETNRSETLPSPPSSEIFSRSKEEVGHELDHPKESQEATDAIAGLAYMGNIKSGKVSEDETISSLKRNNMDQDFFDEDLPETPNEEVKKKKSNQLYTYLFVGSLIGILLVYFTTPDPRPKPKKRTTKAAVKKPINKGKKNSKKNPVVKQTTKVKKVTPKKAIPFSAPKKIIKKPEVSQKEIEDAKQDIQNEKVDNGSFWDQLDTNRVNDFETLELDPVNDDLSLPVEELSAEEIKKLEDELLFNNEVNF